MNRSRRASRARESQRRLQPLLMLLVVAILGAIPCAAQTCNYTVTSLADSGTGSLRAGLSDPTVTDICFNVTGTITLSSTLLIAYPVTITGNVTIDGNNQVQIFQVYESSGSDAVRINGLVLTRGNATSGGALQVVTGNVTLVGTSIGNSTAASGGGVFNQSTLTLSQCNISNNTTTAIAGAVSTGGGIYNDGNAVLTLQGTTVSQNSSSSGAGGLYNAGTAQVTGGIFSANTGYAGGAINNDFYASLPITGGTTFQNNSAAVGGAIQNLGTTRIAQALFTGNTVQGAVELTAGGGALYSEGTATVTESTLNSNSSAQNGGAIDNLGGAVLTLVNDTLDGNSAPTGSGLNNDPNGIVTMSNTIIVGTAPSCNGCGTVAANNLVDVEPYLGPLAANGGPTFTMMPLPGGPAVGGGDPNAIVDDSDERGFSRLSSSGSVDIGAVQSHYSAVTYLTQPSNAFVNQAITPPVAVQVLEVDGTNNNYPQGVPVVVSLFTSQGIQAFSSLSGTLTQPPVVTNGITSANFADLAVNTPGSYELQATIVPAAIASSASLDPAYGVMSTIFQINPAPVITWQPAPVTYGPMPATELNATATINGTPATGTFVYTFSGTGAPITVGQIYPVSVYKVQVTFTPTGSTSQYTLATSLQVTQATPVLTWPTPAAIYTSTPLSSTQLDATATGVTGAALPGTFVYNPAAGTTLPAGSQVLSVTFTPTDTANYTTATTRVTIQVNAVTAAGVAINTSANPITFGQSETFTATVTGTDGRPFSGGTVTFNVDGVGIGSATVVNGSGAVTDASLTGGTHQAGVTYSDTTTTQTLTASTSVTVNKATPVLTWPTPAPIFTVTPLSSTQLDATAAGVTGASLPGTFVYTPAVGAMLPAGSQTLSTTFTPTDTVDYTTATAQVTIQVGYSAISIVSVSPGTATLGTTPLTITITGSGFTSTSVVEVNGTTIATSVHSSTSLTATIPTANLSKAGTLTLLVYDPASKFSSNSVQFTVTAPPADVTLSIPPNTGSGEQPTVTIVLNSPYPSDLQGTLTLTFAPSASNGVDDPAIQLSTGGRTLTFTIPAGSVTAPQVALQTGTVAGTITLTLTLAAGGADVTPTGLTPITIVIAPAAPMITTVTFTNSSDGKITVAISGFSNTRDMDQAEFVFTGTGAGHLSSTKVDVPVTALFSPWYSSSASDQYGSEFTYTQNFQLSKPDAGVTGVAVTLANSVGTSGSVNSQ